VVLRSPMLPDVTKLSEDQLIELNRRIVERLQLLRSARSLAQLARFSRWNGRGVRIDDGRTVAGTIARLNQRTATVVTASGRWRASAEFLRRPTKTPHTHTQSVRYPSATVECVPDGSQELRELSGKCWMDSGGLGK